MKKLVLSACTLVFLVFAGPALALPCTSQSLTAYIGLGSAGCTVDGFQFSGFSAVTPVSPGNVQVPAASITLTPVSGPAGPGFSISSGTPLVATAGQALEVWFGLTALPNPGARFTGNTISLDPSATPVGDDAAITIVEDKCLEGSFSSPSIGCSGTPLTSIVYATEVIGQPLNQLSETKTFAPASFFDVFVDLVVDSGPTGSATLGPTLGEIRVAFVPEPPSLALTAFALVLLAYFRHRKNFRVQGAKFKTPNPATVQSSTARPVA